MKRSVLTTGIILLTLAMGGSCILFHKRPWKNAEQRTRFMLKMTAELVSPVPNHCIDELHDQLKKHTTMSPDVLRAHFPAMGINPGGTSSGGGSVEQDVKGKIVLVQDSGPRRCEDALRSCGNCHLPKKNNCEYRVFYGENKSVRGLVQGRKGDNLLIAARESYPVAIPIAKIDRSIWLNGADPLHTWWDFKNFGRKGKTAKTMLHLAATHGVACTNCHVRHGDFRLTKEGKIFLKEGRVVKRVPLNAFH